MSLERRRALMAQNGGESGPVWLYNNGVTSDIIGGWNTTGYKYNSNSDTDRFGQTLGSTALIIYAISKYNHRGGRTFTSDNIISSVYVGKTLHVKGYWEMNGDLSGGRDSSVFAFMSDSVQDVSTVESVLSSGAFTNEIHAQSTITTANEMSAGTTRDFEIVLPITKTGHLSLVMYKGNKGLLYSYFKEVWIE